MPVLCFDLSADEQDGSMTWFDNATTYGTGTEFGARSGEAFWARQTVPTQAAPTCSGTADEASDGSTDCATIFAAATETARADCPLGCDYDPDVYLKYMTADETKEKPYSSYSGISYPSGGFVVQNIQEMFENAPSVSKNGNELFPWPHQAIDSSRMIDAGLLHPATRVIFHDYTIYSGTKDAYVNVRLTLEMGLDHGLLIPTRHVRLVRLTSWPEYAVVFEVMFYMVLLFLGLENIWFYVTQIFGAEEALEEALELARFELRYQILQQAAFKNLFAYRPRVLMKQIESKVRKVKMERTHHITALNKLGCRISSLHESFQRLMNMDAETRMQGQKPEDKAMAILDVLASFEHLKERVVDLQILKGKQKSPKYIWKRLYIRLQNASKVFRADSWRVLDAFNYGFFFLTFIIRLKINPLMVAAETAILDINRGDPYADTEYVQMYEVTYMALILTYAYAVNAVLTWLKVFKFFSYFPSMQILTRTLGYAAAPLGSFSVILMVVLIAFGQAFFLSFGLDLLEYRTFNTSVFALLRMAVGDFDYVRLEQSHNVLGPCLFWMYIFLVFFILMSVFIALISEAYEKAKTELEDVEEAAQQTVVVEDPVRTLDEARHRLDSVAPGLVSDAMMASMLESLPKTEAKRQNSIRDRLRSKMCICRASDEKRWKSGPLSQQWVDNDGQPMDPVDLFTDDGHEWVNTNDLRDYAGYQAEQSGSEIPPRQRIKKDLLVCKISNPNMKGTVIKKEGQRACVDFREGDHMRSGLASISNLLGSNTGGGGKGFKGALLRAMSRASEVHKKHPSDWTEDDVVMWAKETGIKSVVDVADKFKENGVNGKCLMHLDRQDLHDIGVTKINELKIALVQIRQLSKIPKKITMDHTLDKDAEKKAPRPPGSSPVKKATLPGQVSFADDGGGDGDDKDEVDRFIDEELGGSSETVHAFLLNKDSKWVKFTRGDQAFYQNTGIKGLNSLKMPREGIKGEKVLDVSDDSTGKSFQKNYEKAKKMDEMKQRARAETGAWGTLVGQAKAGPAGPEPAPAPIPQGIAGPPNTADAAALAEQIRAAESAD